MQARTLDHIVLEIKNLEASLNFYHQLLGMETVRLDSYYAGTAPFPSVKIGNTLIDLFVTDSPQVGLNHFCVEVSNPIAEILGELKQHDIAYENLGQRFGALGEGTSVYIKDPDGYTVEIRTYQSS